MQEYIVDRKSNEQFVLEAGMYSKRGDDALDDVRMFAFWGKELWSGRQYLGEKNGDDESYIDWAMYLTTQGSFLVWWYKHSCDPDEFDVADYDIFGDEYDYPIYSTYFPRYGKMCRGIEFGQEIGPIPGDLLYRAADRAGYNIIDYLDV